MTDAESEHRSIPLLEHGRVSGVLLHPTSLPGPGGVGSVGAAAHRWVEWLTSAGQSCWQILPLVDTDEGGSPYNGLSAVGGNPLLIDLHELITEGLLEAQELGDDPAPEGRVDYPEATRRKGRLLELAFGRLQSSSTHRMHRPLDEYRERNARWIEDYALFRALRQRDGSPWTTWRPELRRRNPDAVRSARTELAEDIGLCVFQQFLFDRQWAAVLTHAHENGLTIIGDIPIFVAHDSADVWANQELFQLNPDGNPSVVSGVPPDYFSRTGQRWGNPLFRWDVLKEQGYTWWVDRFRRTLEWVDVVRIDHFRGFQAYWEIPADEATAVNGRWVEGPGAGFFRAVQERLGDLPVIAEDLGLITAEVDALRVELGYPGMRVTQFAFDEDPRNPHLPENYPEQTVAYTGTHDNDTIVGWWEGASAPERLAARQRFPSPDDAVNQGFLEMVFGSAARLAIVPIQDVLGLGSEARMNTPGTSERNWTWRLREEQLRPEHATWLREITCRSGRCRDL